MFNIVADLIIEAELSSQHTPIQSFDDMVIALSLDSGLPIDETQSRLVERMLMNKNGGFTIAKVFSVSDGAANNQISDRA